jgi:release factor glutamine methyltransferase
VYVPRPQTQALARRAADHLPPTGVALDLCTGSGAIAVALRRSRPRATVVASDADPVAVACARRNGITTFLGDLDDAVPDDLRGTVDVLTAVTPYVPSGELRLLPRDVVAFEPTAALDGGPDGTDVLRRIVGRSGVWLRAGGWLLLELGGDQALEVRSAMQAVGFGSIRVQRDAEGDVRSVEGRLTRFPGRG